MRIGMFHKGYSSKVKIIRAGLSKPVLMNPLLKMKKFFNKILYKQIIIL